jgi:RHS repeat-associated protein
MAGNTVQHVLSTGSVDNWIRYMADGEGRRSTLGTTGSLIDTYSNFGSQWGYRTDPVTGLELVGNRYLDYNDGRWITRDPIGQVGGANLYEYAGDNPTDNIDPSGLMSLGDVGRWYMGGMGGGSELADKYLMNGSVGNFGTMAGDYDSGCATGLQVAAAGLAVAGNAALLVIPGGDEAKGAELGSEAAADALRNVCENGGCFVAGTPVEMADGTTKPIEDIKVGDAVKSRDLQTGRDEDESVWCRMSVETT